MICANCGHRNPDDANFCSSCGAALGDAELPSDTTLTFAPSGEAEGEDELALTLEELEEGKGILVVGRGPEAGTKFFLDTDVVTIGRDPESDVFLGDMTVSRKHAEIRREGTEFRLVDVGSLNGTFLNRRRVDGGPLANGDEIQVGKFKLLFFTGAKPAA